MKTTERQRAQVREWQAANPFRFLMLAARSRARKTGREFALTEAGLRAIWPADGRCPVLGITMTLPGHNARGRSGPRQNSASLDRIDNARGYTQDNVAIISWRANRIKDTATAAELSAVASWLDQRRQLQELF